MRARTGPQGVETNEIEESDKNSVNNAGISEKVR